MLRTRLFLNLIPFVLILLAIGLYAISLFSRLASDVEVIVMENYNSLVAADQLEDVVEKMQGGVWFIFKNLPELGRDTFDQSKTNLTLALHLQVKNVTPGIEETWTTDLIKQCGIFQSAGEEIFRQELQSRQYEIYDKTFYPAFDSINDLLGRIRDMNHFKVLDTTQSANDIVSRVTRLMLIGMLLAVVIASYACYKLGQSIIEPIRSLMLATSQLGRGRLDTPVPVARHDELGDLAVAFNEMASQLQAYRRSTSDEIMRLHRTMETTLASFADPIFVINRDGVVELRNRAAEELSARLDWRAELPLPLQVLVRQVLATGINHIPDDFKEAAHFRWQNVDRYYLPRVLAMKRDDGPMLGVAVALYDITRFRLLDDMKTNLIATVSHELKTPLTSVRMAFHLLLEESLGPLTAKQRDLLQTARDDTERLLRLLNDLLDIARLEYGGADLRRETVAAAEVFLCQEDAFEEMVRAAGLLLERRIDPDLPEVSVDLPRICLVLSNFFSNAVKYSPGGGTIVLVVRSVPDGVEYAVSDQGAGIPEAFRSRVFDRFFRVPGQAQSGAGLGLSIAKEIVVAHGGRIGVRGLEGETCEFFFVLPVATVPDVMG